MSTSTAIVLAGALIGLGLFFGLRAAVVSAPSEPASTVAAPPPVLDAATSQRNAERALAYHRPALRQDCYLPAVAGEPSPPRVAFELSYTFDPSGIQVARGLVEVPGTSRPEVTRCLTAKLPPLRIPAPGRVALANVSLSFP